MKALPRWRYRLAILCGAAKPQRRWPVRPAQLRNIVRRAREALRQTADTRFLERQGYTLAEETDGCRGYRFQGEPVSLWIGTRGKGQGEGDA